MKPRLLAALGFLVLTILSATAQDKLNVLFILADDLGYRDVGFNHPETFYETPHLDRLAASGMVFTDFGSILYAVTE